MEVGIEDCLHIEFEYDKAAYHLNDVVVGKIYFLLVRIKLKYMEIEIRRREITGSGVNARSDSETIAKYEIMDGAPVRGENIPIRYVGERSGGTLRCYSDAGGLCACADVYQDYTHAHLFETACAHRFYF